MTHNQYGNTLRGIFAFILISCGPVARHTQRGCSNSQRALIPPPLGPMRKVPLLRWDQIDQMVKSNELPRVIHAEVMLETDVPGKRTFAVQVRDNSMQPLFSEGEIIFVNPDLPSEPGHYVVVENEDGRPEGALFR
jgi:SOS-response transcriptional repressor LexA